MLKSSSSNNTQKYIPLSLSWVRQHFWCPLKQPFFLLLFPVTKKILQIQGTYNLCSICNKYGLAYWTSYQYTINSSTLFLSALKIMPAFVDIVIIIFVHVCYILPTNTINTYPWLNAVYTCTCISLLRVSFEEPRFSSLSPPFSWWVRLLFPLLWGCPGKVPG